MRGPVRHLLYVLTTFLVSFQALAMMPGASERKEFFSQIDLLSEKFSTLKNLIQNMQIQEKKEDELRGKHALFIPFQNIIYVNEELKKQSSIQQLSIISHELGHAVAYQKLSPLRLAEIANTFGPWPKATAEEIHSLSVLNSAGFKAPLFSKSHAKINATNATDTVPSRYALENRMEWFAECFASWALENVQKNSFAKGQKTFKILNHNSIQFSKFIEETIL
jgi:hypothetical protein